MPPIDLPFTKVLARLELGTWTPLSRSNAERLRNENARGLYEIQVRRFTPRSYKWEPLTSDYEHRARAVFRARKVVEEPKPASVFEDLARALGIEFTTVEALLERAGEVGRHFETYSGCENCINWPEPAK